MSFHVELTPQQSKEYYDLLALPKPVPVLQGSCAGCGRGIPAGYLAVITKWSTVNRGGLPFMVPREMYCRGCRSEVSAPVKHRRKLALPVIEKEEPEFSMKEIAVKVFGVMSKEKGMGSKTLTKLAGLPEDMRDTVKVVLKTLLKHGKVQFEDKRWVRV